MIFFAFVYPLRETELWSIMASTKNTREEIERKKRLAFTLFVDNGFEQRVISQITGISETSISKWKTAGNWDEERRIALMGPDKQIRRILMMYDTMLTDIEKRKSPHNCPNSKEADVMNKMADTVRKLTSETTFFIKAEVGKLFITYLQEAHGQARAVEVVELWHEFLMSNVGK